MRATIASLGLPTSFLILFDPGGDTPRIILAAAIAAAILAAQLGRALVRLPRWRLEMLAAREAKLKSRAHRRALSRAAKRRRRAYRREAKARKRAR